MDHPGGENIGVGRGFQGGAEEVEYPYTGEYYHGAWSHSAAECVGFVVEECSYQSIQELGGNVPADQRWRFLPERGDANKDDRSRPAYAIVLIWRRGRHQEEERTE